MVKDFELEKLYDEINCDESLINFKKKVVAYHMKKFLPSFFICVFGVSLVLLLGLCAIAIKNSTFFYLFYFVPFFIICLILLQKMIAYYRKKEKEATDIQNQYSELYGNKVIIPILKEYGHLVLFKSNEIEKISKISMEYIGHRLLFPPLSLLFTKQFIEETIDNNSKRFAIHDIIINYKNSKMNVFNASCLLATTNCDAQFSHMILTRTVLNHQCRYLKNTILENELSKEFQDTFYVDSNNTELFREILTPELMKKLIELKKYELSIYISNSVLYIIARKRHFFSKFLNLYPYFNILKPCIVSRKIVSYKKMKAIIETVECLKDLASFLI